MRHLFRNLPRLSYQAYFLVQTAVVIIGLGFAAGMLTFQLSGNEDPMDEVALDSLFGPVPEEVVDAPHFGWSAPEEFDDYLYFLVNMAEYHVVDEAMLSEVDATDFTDEQKEIARLMLDSFRQGRANATLLQLSEQTPPAPFSNLALGEFWSQQGFLRDAGRAFEAEAQLSGDNDVRERAVNCYLMRDATDDLIRLLETPDYQHLLVEEREYIRHLQAIQERDWPQIIVTTVVLQYDSIVWQIALITLLTGAAWYAFLMHAADLWRDPKALALCAFVLLLGAMSAFATLFVITIQEDYLGFTEKYDLIGGLLYCIAGIGLREELLKLLFFTPMLPLLLRKKSALLALVVAGCVGLGFAVEENMGYFHRSNGMSGPARFLTANFLHISTTALTGYALYRACLTRGRELDYFATMFGMIVFAHGLYDAFLMVPDLMDLGFFAMMVYVLLCYQVFQVLEQVKPATHRRVSLSFVFTVCLSAVFSICLGWATSLIGLSGLMLLGSSTVGVGLIVIVFFKIINEPVH
ncbi:PrsW family glutamic-type intramembrane protease [Cerasicoccus fimbriatus]|uniref:PrsW family glutamic-type intramembrane protease n=1 Tax=Cerasicoccus fimbriatus TaxID=3014554 RepID=UPI0022B55C7B|nr:PrsW family glutamic-type intramembrane protease [Cerasicoccus sp. TK19100]